jgi:orotate phosphoribosyltransferase-like protein
VAAAREGKVEELMEVLSQRGMSPEDLAHQLDVSEESVRALLQRDEPKPPHERAGISEETIERLEAV